jgi:ribonuclease HII
MTSCLSENSGKRFFYFVDEVGRGCLAGPVVATACCVAFDSPSELLALLNYLRKELGVNDSKSVSALKRKEILSQLNLDFNQLGHQQISRSNMQFFTAQIEPNIIDDVNILAATMLAMQQALSKLYEYNGPQGQHCAFVDGNRLPKNLPINMLARPIIQGDKLLSGIALSSILAKEYRDQLMLHMDSKYPGYFFSQHKGYGTQIHRSSIAKLGPCLIHRHSFAGVKEYVSEK